MPKTERAIILARLARIRALIETLEKTCGESLANRDAFVSLKHEIARTDESLRLVVQTSDVPADDTH